jgi:electron transfer flavoprotein beta subunit
MFTVGTPNIWQIPPPTAQTLGAPTVNIARSVRFTGDGDCIEVERVLSDGWDVLQVGTPALVTVSYEVGNLREPGVEGFLAATKKPLIKWSARDLDIDPARFQKIGILKLYCPERTGQCEMIEGADAGQKAEGLVKVLEERKLI